MIDFSLLSATPFKNQTAFRDMMGLLTIAHQDFAETITRNTGNGVPVYPFASAKDTDLLFALQQQLVAECRALFIAQPTDLSDFNLREESEFYSFTFLLGNEMERIRIAAGL